MKYSEQGTVRYGTVRYGTVRYGTVRYSFMITYHAVVGHVHQINHGGQKIESKT